MYLSAVLEYMYLDYFPPMFLENLFNHLVSSTVEQKKKAWQYNTSQREKICIFIKGWTVPFKNSAILQNTKRFICIWSAESALYELLWRGLKVTDVWLCEKSPALQVEMAACWKGVRSSILLMDPEWRLLTRYIFTQSCNEWCFFLRQHECR